MRYEETAQVSAEYLRLVLPLIARHDLGANPVNYAVWYEYVGGANPRLREAIDAELQAGAGLDASRTEELFRAHVLPYDAGALERLQGRLLAVAASLRTSVCEADSQASQFEDSLQSCSERMRGADAAALGEVVEQLLERARAMQASNAALRHSLEHHAQEAQALRQELDRARQEAVTDPLTGLLNRAGFDRALDEAMQAQAEHGHELCLMLIDIDHFKLVNDTYGHLLGDKVIKMVADIVHRCVKGKDSVARFGGEEFIVLLPETPLRGAMVVAEQVRAAVAAGRIRRLDGGETIDGVSVSVGVGHRRAEEPAHELVARVDAALYRSKSTGRNCLTSAESHAA